jgi:hypothetical protein
LGNEHFADTEPFPFHRFLRLHHDQRRVWGFLDAHRAHHREKLGSPSLDRFDAPFHPQPPHFARRQRTTHRVLLRSIRNKVLFAGTNPFFW